MGVVARPAAKCIAAGLLLLLTNRAGAASPVEATPPQDGARLVREGAWRDLTRKVLVRGESGNRSTTIEVPTKSTSYYVPGARYGFRISLVHDSNTNTTHVMPSSASFYVPTEAGMFAVFVSAYGDLNWAPSMLEVPGLLDLQEVERQFEKAFNETTLAKRVDRDKSLGLTAAAGPEIFTQLGSRVVPLDIRADIAGRLLELDLTNPETTKTARLWIDLSAARIVRAIDSTGLERRNVSGAKLWKAITVQLIDVAGAGPGVTVGRRDVSARQAYFNVLGTSEGFSVTAVVDPRSGNVVFINPQQFYITTNGGMVGGSSYFGVAYIYRPFLETRAAGGILAALARFADSFSAATLRKVQNDHIRVSLTDVLGSDFFVRGSQPVDATTQQVDVTDGILHLAMANYAGTTAAVWLDIQPGPLFAERVVRAERSGRALPIPRKWVDRKARVVRPGIPASLERLTEVDVKYTNVHWGPSPSLAVFKDSQSQRFSVVSGALLIPPPGTTRAGEAFYVPRHDSLMGVSIFLNTIWLSPAYFIAPNTVDGPDATLAAFESSLDWETFERQVAAQTVKIDLAEAVGEDLFLHPKNGRTRDPRVDVIDLQGDTLRMTLTNPETQRSVTAWIDIKNLTLIRASLDGRDVRR
jgi:hypothetical protein